MPNFSAAKPPRNCPVTGNSDSIVPDFQDKNAEAKMANFCTQCGGAMDSGARFCIRCGAAVAEPRPAASGAAATPVAPANGRTVVPSAAPAKSTSAVKVVLIVLAVFLGLGILAGAAVMFGIWGLSRAVKVDPAGENVRIATPMGEMTLGNTGVTEAELGIPIYPGAEEDQAGFRMGTSQGSLGNFVFRSTDPPNQVLDFYRSHFGETVDVVTTPQGGIITSAPREGEGFMVTVGRDENEDKTMIIIVRGISAQ
jgi:hypothetical protein